MATASTLITIMLRRHVLSFPFLIGLLLADKLVVGPGDSEDVDRLIIADPVGVPVGTSSVTLSIVDVFG